MCSQAPDVCSLSDASLRGRLDELERTIRATEAERARCLAEVERRGLHARDGQLSAAAWLAARHRLAQGAAEARVRVARALEQMPRVAEALARGEIPSAAADALVRAREAGPEAFARSEEALVESARSLPHRSIGGASRSMPSRPLATRPRAMPAGGSRRWWGWTAWSEPRVSSIRRTGST
jgi:hypothetical protein